MGVGFDMGFLEYPKTFSWEKDHLEVIKRFYMALISIFF
jgi:hypothetical protein